MLIESKQVLESRKKDIDKTILLLDTIKVENACIVKSSIVLMIYNMIEGVITVMFGEFFSYFIDNNINIDNYSTQLRNMIVLYYLTDIQKKSKKEGISLLSDFRNKPNIEVPFFKDYLKKVSLYSGNLDAEEIRNLAKKFDVVYNGAKGDKNLLYVKNIRNKLAHGEINYSEACRDKSKEEIKSYGDDAYGCLLRVINAFENKYNI